MSIQFQRRFLLEDEASHWLKSTLIELGADEQSANMLVTAVEAGNLTPEQAVAITKATTGVNEEGGSMTAGAGATLEPVRVKKRMEEVSSQFNVNKVWDFIESRPFYNPNYMPKFNTAEEIWSEWGAKEKEMYANFDWKDTYGNKIHPREKAALQRQQNYDALAKSTDIKEDAPILAGGKIKDNYAVSHFGYKEVPKGHAKLKGIIVKDLWETTFMQNAYYGVDGKEVMYLGIKDGVYLFTTVDGKTIEVKDASKVRKLDESIKEIFSKEDQEKAESFLDKLRSTNSKLYRAIVALILDEYPHTGDEIDKLVAGSAELNENYHRFKKETVTRTKAQQMHEAAKAIEKKLHEVNKILEYTSKLKSELFEEGGDSEVSRHTNRVMERVTKSIAEAYSKLKKVK
jgi:hypothetical protein